MRTPHLIRPFLLAVAACAINGPALRAQGPDALTREVRSWERAHALGILSEFRDFLSLPNVASDSVGIRRVADTLVAMLTRRGVQARRLESPGSPPAVFGELRTPGASRTVMLYAHYDGQPVVTKDWVTAGPFSPELRDGHVERGGRMRTLEEAAAAGAAADDWRLYARSASDDKGAIISMLSALDALRAAGRAPAVNLKFFFEGEEEAGSSHIKAMLTAHRELLSADLWLFADGPRHQTGMLQLVHGARGVMGLGLTLYGPSRPLHSGHYGNWAPNPAAELTRLLASMRADDGTITIAGFDQPVRPITAEDRAAVLAMPAPDAGLRAELKMGRTESDLPLGLAILRPALNITSLSGGTGTNSIMATASATLDFRMVPDQTPAGVRALVEKHVESQGYFVVHTPPDSATLVTHPRVALLAWGGGYAGQRTPLSLPIARELHALLEQAIGAKVGRVPTLGGSLPLSEFEEVLHLPILTLPIANYDNNQHAANEHLRLGNLWDGIAVFAAVMAGLGGAR
ncbi:MAG: M20/M25/M40 family metallo-hydrolase [Gemmatimonadota bacterium]|nr:M20/M25/M40 family metallo-hydrolase [Gemmatimonadota bacterium]